MKYNKIPHSDLEVSEICLGTMNWGEQNTENDAHEQLDYATDNEVNFIDTAEVYPIPPNSDSQGRTETYLGNWLKKTGKRDDLIIASKVVSRSDMEWIRSNSQTPRLTKEHILEAIEGSLKRLQTDRIDLYQLHWPDRATNFFGKRGFTGDEPADFTPLEESLEALEILIKEGKVRYIGVSNETAWGLMKYIELHRNNNLPRIVTTQNTYNLTNRTLEVGVSEVLTREEIGLLAYSPLAFGTLSGKYLDGELPEGSRFHYTERNSSRYNPEHAQEAIRKYVQLAKENNLDPAQMAIKFTLNRSFNISTIIGARTIEQLKTDIDSINIELSKEVLSGIEKIYTEHPDPCA